MLLSLALLTIVVTTRNPAQSDFWEPTSGPRASEVNDLITNPGRVRFVATNYGVLRSIPGGGWEPLSNLPGPVYSLALDSSGNILAGGYGTMHRTTDDGASWTMLDDSLDAGFVNCIAVDAIGAIYAGIQFGGVVRSTDDGASWQQTSLDSANVTALVISPGGALLAGSYERGIERSPDGGVSWAPSLGTGTWGSPTIVVADSVWTIAGFASIGGGLHRSSDDGLTWIPADSGFTFAFRFVISLCTNAGGTLFASVIGGLLRSTDQGASWTNNHVSPPHDELFGSRQGPTIYGEDGRGLFRSTDDAGSWELIGVPTSQVRSLATNAVGEVFAASMNSGLFRSGDGGVSWASLPMAGYFVFVAGTGTVFSTHEGSAIPENYVGRSIDNGDTWSYELDGLPFNSKARSMAEDPGGELFLGTIDSGVFRSSDDGLTWTKFDSGLTDLDIRSLLALSEDIVLAGTRSSGVFISSDNGARWREMNDGLPPGARITSLAADVAGYLYCGTDTSGMFRSDDTASWTPLDIAPWEPRGIAILVYPGDALIVALSSGVILSTDHGETWMDLSSGYPSGTGGLAITYDQDGRLYVGTNGHGVYRSVNPFVGVSGDSEDAVPTRYSLSQNYPNPFNAVTLIEYQIPARSRTSIVVYNVLGERLTTLVDGVEEPGAHAVRWNADRFPGGVYFYRIVSGGFTDVKKMVLMK